MHLIVDTRERAIIPFIEQEIESPTHAHTLQIEQINIGDYVICTQSKILMCIERKTYDDFADSLRDGRYKNKEKMIEYRERTGCKLLYIIEGPAFPSDERRFKRIPYKSILAAEDHMMIRDDISIIHVKDSAHTAKRIIDFMNSYEDLMKRNELPADLTASAAATDISDVAGGTDGATAAIAATAATAAIAAINPDDLKHLKTRTEKPISHCVQDCWASLPNVSQSTAIQIKWSVKDFIANADVYIPLLKSPAGRDLHTKTKHILRTLNTPEMAHRFISAVPGISAASGKKITDAVSIVDMTAEILEQIDISATEKPRKLGPAKAAKIMEILEFSR